MVLKPCKQWGYLPYQPVNPICFFINSMMTFDKNTTFLLFFFGWCGMLGSFTTRQPLKGGDGWRFLFSSWQKCLKFGKFFWGNAPWTKIFSIWNLLDYRKGHEMFKLNLPTNNLHPQSLRYGTSKWWFPIRISGFPVADFQVNHVKLQGCNEKIDFSYLKPNSLFQPPRFENEQNFVTRAKQLNQRLMYLDLGGVDFQVVLITNQHLLRLYIGESLG